MQWLLVVPSRISRNLCRVRYRHRVFHNPRWLRCSQLKASIPRRLNRRVETSCAQLRLFYAKITYFLERSDCWWVIAKVMAVLLAIRRGMALEEDSEYQSYKEWGTALRAWIVSASDYFQSMDRRKTESRRYIEAEKLRRGLTKMIWETSLLNG